MYKVVKVPDAAYEDTEQLGTKFKFWFLDENNQQFLFKQGRENTGENWSEKVCCELARTLELPHAEYDLAEWRNVSGVVSPIFVEKGERLVLGNELVTPNVKRTQYSTNHHLIRKVTSFLKMPIIKPPHAYSGEEKLNANEVFIGYLMLDALVGNTDRHDENWGVVLSKRGIELAPTYDHASSLGRELSDEERLRRLETKDVAYNVEAYAARARSALFNNPEEKRPLTTLEAFLKGAESSKKGRDLWLGRLQRLNEGIINNILAQMPYANMSSEAKNFALQLLLVNQRRLEKAVSQ